MNIDKIEVVPLESFNGIKFGTSRDKVWELIGKPTRGSFKKTEGTVDTDDYGFFHIFYDKNYNFEAIDVFDDLDIYLNGYKLPKKYSELVEYFKTLYDDVKEDEDGFVSIKGSIGVYVENDEDKVDVITFGVKDYFNYMNEI